MSINGDFRISLSQKIHHRLRNLFWFLDRTLWPAPAMIFSLLQSKSASRRFRRESATRSCLFLLKVSQSHMVTVQELGTQIQRAYFARYFFINESIKPLLSKARPPSSNRQHLSPSYSRLKRMEQREVTVRGRVCIF